MAPTPPPRALVPGRSRRQVDGDRHRQRGEDPEEDRAGNDQPRVRVAGAEGDGTGDEPEGPTDDGRRRAAPASDVHAENPAGQDADGPDPEGQDDEVSDP